MVRMIANIILDFIFNFASHYFHNPTILYHVIKLTIPFRTKLRVVSLNRMKLLKHNFRD
jgi:hypothetical protein